MNKLFFLILFSFFLVACASLYKPEGFGGGYSEIQLDENVFRVNFRGNGYTSPERAADLALLRSADLALQNGYAYFIIISSTEYSQYSTYTTPTTVKTTGNAFGSGGTVFGDSTTTINHGETYVIARPHATNTIVCFKEKPKNINGLVYNAQSVYESLSRKYKRN